MTKQAARQALALTAVNAPRPRSYSRAVLQVARTPTKLKVPFLGNLYASLALNDRVDRPYANFLISIARRLTFRQLTIIAMVWEGDDGRPTAETASRG